MNKVISINLNGNAYQLEESAYQLLQKYLDGAEAKLADDPDKDEILADFEQAVADKCSQYLSGQKTVVTGDEMQDIIQAMGPVSADARDGDATAPQQPQAVPKRFYLIKEGSVIGGVCTGISAYLNVDVTIVRLAFIVLTFLTGGAWIIGYIAAMVVAPEAKTPEEKAAARGEQFSAHDLLTRAKQRYADVADDQRWHTVADQAKPALSSLGNGIGRAGRMIAGLTAVGMAAVAAVLTMAWFSIIWSVALGRVQLYDQLATIPQWHLAMAVTALFYLCFVPLLYVSSLAGHISRYGLSRMPTKWWHTVTGLLWFAAIGVLIVLAVSDAGVVTNYVHSHSWLQANDHRFCLDVAGCMRE